MAFGGLGRFSKTSHVARAPVSPESSAALLIPSRLRSCGRKESKPHALRRWNLNPVRLPIPPRPHERSAYERGPAKSTRPGAHAPPEPPDTPYGSIFSLACYFRLFHAGGMSPFLVAAGLVLSQPVVVDGDTLRDGQGERYRVENIDAPERGRRARCDAERVLAEQARDALIEWVTRARRAEAFPVGRRDRWARGRLHPDRRREPRRAVHRARPREPWHGRRAIFARRYCQPHDDACGGFVERARDRPFCVMRTS